MTLTFRLLLLFCNLIFLKYSSGNFRFIQNNTMKINHNNSNKTNSNLYSDTYYGSGLYYQYPNQPISNPNVTIAGVFSIVSNDNLYNVQATANMMTMVCEVERYNSGLGRFPVKGVFNFLGYETKVPLLPSGYIMARDVLGQNVYFQNNSTSIGNLQDTPINVILRMGNALDFSVESAFFSGVVLPSINYDNIRFTVDDLNYPLSVPELEISYGMLIMDRGSAQIFTDYVIDVLTHFNWSFFACIFSLDVTGFLAQNSFLSSIEEQSNKFTFSCAYAIDTNDSESYNNTLQSLSKCLLDSTVIRVIVVWMRAEDAVNLATQLNELIGGPDSGFIYIFPELPAEFASKFNLPGSLFFDPLILSSTAEFSCSAEAKQSLLTMIGPEAIDRLTILSGFCRITDPNLPACEPDRNSPNCVCLDDLVFYAPYASDSVSLLMKSISNMQENCAALTECVQNFYPPPQKDYCGLNDFSGEDLYKAMQCSPFIGSSGNVSYNNLSVARATFPMVLKQFKSPGQDPSIIGEFATSSIRYFNNSYFPATGGDPPVSAIVPNDPNLSDSFMVAFFVIDLLLIIVNLFLLVFVAFNWESRVIRNSGASSTVVILIGLLLIEVSEIFMFFDLTAALCKLIDIFMFLGISFVISTLCAKLYRIYKIFQNPTAQAISITDRDLIIFTVATSVLTIVLFILYSVLGGNLQPITQTASLNPLYTFVICEVPNGAIQTIGIIVFYVYYLSLFLIAAVLSFMTRKTMRQFNESLNVAFIVYSWLAVCLIYAPIYYAQGDSTNSNQIRYAVRFVGMDLAILIALSIISYNQCFKVIRWNRKQAKLAKQLEMREVRRNY